MRDVLGEVLVLFGRQDLDREETGLDPDRQRFTGLVLAVATRGGERVPGGGGGKQTLSAIIIMISAAGRDPHPPGRDSAASSRVGRVHSNATGC